MKRCSHCKNWKEESEFCRNKSTKDGLCCQCKSCINEYYKANAKEIKRQGREYRRNHADEIKEYQRTHTEKIKEYKRNYAQSHRKEQKEYYETNKEAIKKQQKRYRETHREERNKYLKNRQRSNPQLKLSHNMSTAIWHSLKSNKNGKHWEDIVGYTQRELRKHLEKQFKEDMTWENYGEWHVDHIIPVSAHNYNSYTDIDFKQCWALENLRPMWAHENCKKNNRLKTDFQPSLTL